MAAGSIFLGRCQVHTGSWIATEFESAVVQVIGEQDISMDPEDRKPLTDDVVRAADVVVVRAAGTPIGYPPVNAALAGMVMAPGVATRARSAGSATPSPVGSKNACSNSNLSVDRAKAAPTGRWLTPWG